MVVKISLGELYTAMCSSKPILYKAIAGLIFSSTMTPSTISKLTLNDFLVACGDYFDENEEMSLENLLKKDPWKIIPHWNLKSKSIITFNTPETTFFMFLYLKEKRMDDLSNLNNPLFKSGNNNFLTSSKISSYVTEFNTVLNIFYDDYGNKFKSKNLIATFDEIYDNQMYIEKESKFNLIKLFKGKMAKNSKFYRYADKNPKKLKEFYKRLVPYLTAREYNVNNNVMRNRNYLYDEELISEAIQDFYNYELKDDLNLDYTQEQLLCKFAGDLSDFNSFSNDKIYLNKLFMKAMITLKVYNYDFEEDLGIFEYYVSSNSNPEVYAKKLEKDCYRLGVYDLIDIDREELYKILIKHVIKNNYCNKDMSEFIAERIIYDVCYDLIDKMDEIFFSHMIILD